MQYELFIRRCFDLARLGNGKVSPNPMVGAVIVYDDRIIGEGFHTAYGQAHAEVNAIASVKTADRTLLKKATIFISLEPCNIYGNTPPCTELIIREKIPMVVFSSFDKTPEVDGKSLEILREAGCKVSCGVLQNEGDRLAASRNIFVAKKRPYVILKFAQSQDGFIGKQNETVWLTNAFSKRLVHKWRSESGAILIGTNTAATDNPKLTTRLYFGKNPLRIILDRKLSLDRSLNIYDDAVPTWIITGKNEKNKAFKHTRFVQIQFDKNLIYNLLDRLYEQKVNSLIVEGGASVLQSFITLGLWDEARVFITSGFLQNGIKAPPLPYAPTEKYSLGTDNLFVFRNLH